MSRLNFLPNPWLLFCLALLGTSAVACQQRQENHPRIVALQLIDSSSNNAPAHGDKQALTQIIIAKLGSIGTLPVALAAPARDGIDYKLRVELRLDSAENDTQYILHALADARLIRSGKTFMDTPISHEIVAEKIYRRDEIGPQGELRPSLASRHLARVLDDLLTGLMAQMALHQAKTEELLKVLADSSQPAMQAEAMQVAAERRERRAVPNLIELLKNSREEIRDLAIGALVEIGDRRAVPPLTRLSRFDNLDELPKVIDAVASLGGDEARAYLNFIATSHDQPDIRSFAGEALARLDKRAQAHKSPAPAAATKP